MLYKQTKKNTMTYVTTINMKNWRNNKHPSCSVSSDLLSDRLPMINIYKRIHEVEVHKAPP